jgi:hypothetical protein
MARKWLRRTVGVGVVAGLAYTLWRAIEANRVDPDPGWESQPFPFPPQPRTDTPPRPVRVASDEQPARDASTTKPPVEAQPGWCEPTDGACPSSHPIKAKLSSKIFHVPGGFSYDRTIPDRCYVDAPAAEADGFRAAKR